MSFALLLELFKVTRQLALQLYEPICLAICHPMRGYFSSIIIVKLLEILSDLWFFCNLPLKALHPSNMMHMGMRIPITW